MLLVPRPNLQSLLLCINKLIFWEINENYTNTVYVAGSYHIDFPVIRYTNLTYDYVEALFTNAVQTAADHPFKPTIFLIDSERIYPDLEDFFSILNLSPFFNSIARYIIIDENPSVTMAQVMKSAKMTNVIFVQPSSGKIRTMTPFRNKQFFFDITSLEDSGTCDNLTARVQQTSRDLFNIEDKEFWKGWKLKFCYREICKDCNRGNEYKIFEIILATLQMEREYLPIKNFDETCAIMYGHLMRNHQQMGFQYTIPYMYDAMWWFIPQPELHVTEWFPFKIFSFLLWGLYITSIFFITAVWLLIKLIREKHISLIDSLKVFKISSILFLEQNTNWITVPLSEAELKIICIFLAFMLNAIYKGKLLYVLLRKEYVPHNYTVNEMHKQNLTVGYSITDMSQRSFIMYNGIQRKCNSSFECLSRAAFKKEFPVIAFGRDEKDARPFLFDENGRYLLRKLTPAFSISNDVAVVIPGHPFFHIFNKYILYLLDHGFVEYITRSSVELSTELTLENEILRLEHVKAPGLILVIGVTLSIVAFVFEYFKWSSSKMANKVKHT
ncbi:hypothetical protein HHI36_020356 [Cryptolaemus montrouzieri]|uniref:Ionotropic receptor n=1 Tax=Cryptolaemus montrouzieri TaxID=559131 RepID=A0ABD2NAG6_9CUCU